MALTSSRYRYLVLSIIFGGALVCYLDRMAMAIAIPFIAHDFRLTSLQMGEVLSAFFLGYTLMQIPGGMLADRLGPRVTLAMSIAWWSVMTAITGMANGLRSMLGVRVLFGLGEGPYPSAAAKALSIWFPPVELGWANGAYQAATSVGATIAPLVAVALILHWGWRAMFYALAVPGALLAVLTWACIRSAPATSAPTSGAPEAERIPLRAGLLKSLNNPAVLWCAACLFLANVAGWGMSNWLPTYLLRARGIAVEQMGFYTALINFATGVGSVLGGFLCDRYFKGSLGVPIICGLLLSAGATYLGAAAGTGEWAVAWIAAASLCQGVALTAIFTVPIVVASSHSVGASFGVVNTAGQLAGVLSPPIFGALLDATHGDFFVVLCSMVAFKVLAALPALRLLGRRRAT